jgi:hypothetical protein
MSLRRSPFRVQELLTAVAILALAPSRNALGADSRAALDRPLSAFDAAAVERAKAGAARWLQKPECLKVLTDFTDGERQTLDRSLAAWGKTADEYVLSLPFRDGAAIPRCRQSGMVLLTIKGFPRVYVCPVGVGPLHSPFSGTQIRSPSLAEAMVIHEMLHTLGLGENPPTSGEITARVRARCR